MTNVNNSVLYTGVTSDIIERVYQHKSRKHLNGFTARYNVCKLVYFESFLTIGEAIKREKAIKGGSRKRKLDLINSVNPEWNDLSLILEGK